MSNHTAGPWEAIGPDVFEGDIFNPGKRICQCSAQGPFEEHRANARLIAAAPELLAICKGVLNAIEAFPYSGSNGKPLGTPKGGIARSLREAIAKAEGKGQ